MDYTLRIVCRPEVAAGFALAGFHPMEAAASAAGIAAVQQLLAQPDVGVALVEDLFYEALPEELRRQVGRQSLPLLIPFPGPAWVERPAAAEAYIVELLRQVIGYRVRLK